MSNTESVSKLAAILGTSTEALLKVDAQMSAISGQKDALDQVVQENNQLIGDVLGKLNLTRDDTAENIYHALSDKLSHADGRLFEFLDRPDLSKMSVVCGKLCDVALQIFKPPKGLFIKKEKVAELLEKDPPTSLLEKFGYASVKELVEKEGFASVVAALRFSQSQEWMHSFFDKAYNDLKPEDFEERDVEMKILDSKWLADEAKFIKKKFHNVSHLKEYGVIFVTPIPIDTPGETIRMFLLLLHYLHEVPFYSDLFRRYMHDADFLTKFKSLLRGDVPDEPAREGSWRIVQRYLTKDDPKDFRLSEHHINPEADHWYRAEQDLVKLDKLLASDLSFWSALDFAGDFFHNEQGQQELITFNLIDSIMSLVGGSGEGSRRGTQPGIASENKYKYHQREALWNKIFIAHFGYDRMTQEIKDHIIDGFIKL